MSYNDGQVHLDFYDKEVDIEKIAKEFSEGDPLLCNSLLELWKNGIKTSACCRGHNENATAYISLVINDNSQKLIQAISEYLYLQDDKMELDFINHRDGYDTFTVGMADEKTKNEFLTFLCNFLKEKKGIEDSNTVLKYANYLLLFAKKMGLSCRYAVEKNEMMFSYSYPGTIQLFDENAPRLDDLIESIRETGNLPLMPIRCDEKSLEQFINIIFPNAFVKKSSIMSFNELKETIEQAKDKKSIIGGTLSFDRDSFRIRSALYSNDIFCNNIESVNDIYNVVNKYQLDSNLFSNPFYIIVALENFDEKTIEIINQLDSNIHVQIAISKDIDDKLVEMLFKIKHKNCHFYFGGYIYMGAIEKILSKENLDIELGTAVIIIDKITSNTINVINSIGNIVTSTRFRIEIKDKDSLLKLNSIVPYIPEDEALVIIDDNLFNEKNPNNARDLIVQENKIIQTKKMNIYFNDICYESVEQIYELEKYLEIIKSHIPSNAIDLDIVTYVSMFIINYFKYDYDMYDGRDSSDKDINLTQFVTSGKGVCRHFASFTKYLLNSLDIECERVDANGNFDVEGHSFNVATIDGKMYFLDNTWLAGRMQSGEIQSLAESSDYLTSIVDFGHEDYKDELENYVCESCDREEINKSVARVLNWNKNYIIHPTALRDLFRKHVLKKKSSVEQKIETAIPRRR